MTPDHQSAASLGRQLGLSDGLLDRVRGPTGPVSSVLGDLFIKPVPALDQALAEVDGLLALCGGNIRVPEARGIGGRPDGVVLLVLEWLPLSAPPDGSREALADSLVDWHRMAPSARFGWARDNYIGATPQANQVMDDWPGFFARQRLQPQLALASPRLAPPVSELVETVIGHLPALLEGAGPAVRLHGDLWRGNLAWSGGQPALYDPAVYYGPAEVDLAMLELFGEPVSGLVPACLERHGVKTGYPLRRQVYHLYHLLNHFNLFGAGWNRGVEDTCRKLLAEVRA